MSGQDHPYNQEGGLPQFGNDDEQVGEQQQQNEEFAQNQNYDWMNKETNPLLYVDINLSADKIERIVVYDGDKPEELAKQFIEKHGLDISLLDRLTQMLQMQIEGSINQQQANQ